MRYESSASISNEAIREIGKFIKVNPEEILIRRLCTDMVKQYPFNENIYLKGLTINFINQADLETIKDTFSITTEIDYSDYSDYNVKKYKATINFSCFNE